MADKDRSIRFVLQGATGGVTVNGKEFNGTMTPFGHLADDEIANVLQVGMSTVKMRIHRARLAFQEFFNQFCGRVYLNFPVSSSGKAEMKKE